MRKKRYTIIILGGLLRKNAEGKYRTGRFNYIRVLAGYYLYRNLSKDNQVRLIVSGGKGIYKNIPGIPPVASVMKQELIKLGLSPKEIIEEKKTASTYYELIWLKGFLKKHPGKVIIISNGYHLPRIKAMIGLLPELRVIKRSVELVSAEKIALKYNKNLKYRINKAQQSPKMKKIIAGEKKGIKTLKAGNYKFRK